MREIAIEEVTVEGLLLQMNRTQIFFREIRKEMDKLRNAIKEKTDWSPNPG